MVESKEYGFAKLHDDALTDALYVYTWHFALDFFGLFVHFAADNTARDAASEGLSRTSQEELERLVGVTLAVLTREAEAQ